MFLCEIVIIFHVALCTAFWIALQAVRTVFETEDGLNKSPYDITYVKNKMMEFYHLKSKIGILDHLHKKFNKPQFAGFCKELAIGRQIFQLAATFS